MGILWLPVVRFPVRSREPVLRWLTTRLHNYGECQTGRNVVIGSTSYQFM